MIAEYAVTESIGNPALGKGRDFLLKFPSPHQFSYGKQESTLQGGRMFNRENQIGRIIACMAVAAVFAAGCSMTNLPPAPISAASADYQYQIGAGDTLNIVVWRNPELSMTVPVRPDGKIAAPLVEDLPAMGKDATTLARDIEKALSKVIRDPVVTVIVTNFVGPYSEQIRVIGEATKPQVLAYKQKMTLLDVMIAVGGITDFADGNGASILRTVGGNKQYSVRIKDLVKRGDVSANVEMRPGDVLIIPQSWF